MRAITLKHPWPWAVCRLGKRIENRTWKPSMKVGTWLAIHGGRVPTSRDDLADVADEAKALIRVFGVPRGAVDVTLADVVAHAGIVAVCRFGGWVDRSKDPWFEGPVGWVLEDVVVLPAPVPCKGAQGLWEVSGDTLAAVREAYRLAVAMNNGTLADR